MTTTLIRRTARTLIGQSVSPQRQPVRCQHELIIWDTWSASTNTGSWHHGGVCGRSPALCTVRESCIRCERVKVGHWCDTCVHDNQHELAQQRRGGSPQALLWCLGCEEFGVQIEVTR